MDTPTPEPVRSAPRNIAEAADRLFARIVGPARTSSPVCPACDGDGEVETVEGEAWDGPTQPCRDCNGTGDRP